jgi:hypothetical protein
MNQLVALDQHPELSWGDRIALFAYKISQQQGAKTSEDDAYNLKHMFRGEWYVREMELPGGFVFVGRIHKQGHMVKLLEGSASVRTEFALRRHYAPDTIHTVPGFQMVAYAHTNILAQSWHFNPQGIRDISELEDEFFGNPSAVLQRGEQLAQEKLSWSVQ